MVASSCDGDRREWITKYNTGKQGKEQSFLLAANDVPIDL